MKVRHLFNLLLILLWSATMAGVLTTFSWFYYPAPIIELDSYLKAKFLYEPQQRFKEIMQSNMEPDVLRSSLIALINDLERVQKVDSNSPTKRGAYHELVKSLIAADKLVEARKWADAWREFDQQDVQALLFHARLLYLAPDSREEGELQMALLKRKFKNSLTIADAVATTYASTGELGRAFLEYQPFLPSNADHRRRHVHEELSRAEFHYAPGDPVPDIKLSFLPGEIAAININTDTPDAQLTFNAEGLATTPTGYVKWPIAGTANLSLAAISTNVPVKFSLTVIVPIPQTLSILLQPRFEAMIKQQLAEMGQTDAVKDYDQISSS